MISVSDAVGALVLRSPVLSEGLSRGLLNVAAVARQLQRDVERRVGKPVTTGAIVMALRRLPLADEPPGPLWALAAETDLTLRTNLFEVSFAASPTLFECEGELLRLGTTSQVFMTMTRGLRETTVIAAAELAPTVRELFAGEETIETIENLSSLTIRLPERVLQTPGAYAQLLKLLAWQGINVVEVVSTFRELTILLRREEADRAWAALHRALD